MTTADIAVVSGSYGAGHDAAAEAISEQLLAAGYGVRRLDVAEQLPWRIGLLLRWLYFAQLRWLPGSWGTTLRWLGPDGWATRGVRHLLGRLGRRLVSEVTDTALVISTHPFASQALGEARARGRLAASVVTYLTDASVHQLWVHPSVDLHLAIHEVAAGQARRLGGVSTVVSPAVPSRAAVPTSWSPPWPKDRPAALIVGGSCGVGELQQSALDVLATGLLTPVVACGTNDRLREELDGVHGVLALGWRDDMHALVAAADLVVQNAGGMTSLEAIAAGTPTLTYRPIPGHGTTNAAALETAGLVPWVRDTDALTWAVVDVLVSHGEFALPTGAPSVVEALARRLSARHLVAA